MYMSIGLWIVMYCMATIRPLGWKAQWSPPERGCEGGGIAKRLQREALERSSETKEIDFYGR